MKRLTARRLLAVAVTAALVPVLSACNPQQVGAAAIVDGDTISVDELQQATSDFLTAVPDSDPGDAQNGILQRMLVSRVFESAAESLGVSVSDGEVANQRDQILTSVQPQAREAGVSPRTYVVTQLSQGEQPTVIAPSQIDDWVRDQLLLQGIADAAAGGAEPGSPEATAAANDALTEASRSLDVEVNPRYGRWDPDQGVVPQVGGGLSKTVAELTDSQPAQE